jgi:hypothetical protein
MQVAILTTRVALELLNQVKHAFARQGLCKLRSRGSVSLTGLTATTQAGRSKAYFLRAFRGEELGL